MLRTASAVEATTYLLLVGSVIATRLGGAADSSATLGLLHGSCYLLYAAVVVVVGRRQQLPMTTTVTLLAVAAIPLGGYYIAARHAPLDD